jgi:putative ABC transport system ATP-binding protein
MIEGINITKSFGDRVLFKDFSFSINDGEFVCFSGVSGSGKTTLLNIIGMIEKFDKGTLLFDKNPVKTNRQKIDFYRNKVGFLFQNYALVDNKTVEQNLKLVKRTKKNNCSIMEALEKVGLQEKLKSKVFTLSGGEQQRVGLARLYLKKCKYVLADEPTGSLDRENADIVMEILKDMHLKGKTIVLVTHDERIKQMPERMIKL